MKTTGIQQLPSLIKHQSTKVQQVVLGISTSDEKRIKPLIDQGMEKALIIDHDLHQSIDDPELLHLVLMMPKPRALQTFDDAAPVQIGCFTLDTLFTVDLQYVDEVMKVLHQHLGCPGVRLMPFAMEDGVWTVGDDEHYIVHFGVKNRDEGEIMLRITALPGALKNSRLRNVQDFIRADYRRWISHRVWLVDPQRKQIGMLLRKKKGLGPADASTYIRMFNRTIGSRQFMGHYIARRKQLRALSTNRMGQLFGHH